jgi:hypothetical protein
VVSIKPGAEQYTKLPGKRVKEFAWVFRRGYPKAVWSCSSRVQPLLGNISYRSQERQL